MSTSMTRQHFRALADAIARLDATVDQRTVAAAIANAVRQFNPRFDTGKFIWAATGQDEPPAPRRRRARTTFLPPCSTCGVYGCEHTPVRVPS